MVPGTEVIKPVVPPSPLAAGFLPNMNECIDVDIRESKKKIVVYLLQ